MIENGILEIFESTHSGKRVTRLHLGEIADKAGKKTYVPAWCEPDGTRHMASYYTDLPLQRVKRIVKLIAEHCKDEEIDDITETFVGNTKLLGIWIETLRGIRRRNGG